MKKLILFAAFISATVLTSFAQNNLYGNTYSNTTYTTPSNSYYSTPVYVDSYVKSNGTVVNGYYRTAPDYTISNNFSTYPNVNPYTGKTGTIKQW